MQFNSIYLYPNKIDVYTNVPGTWLKERYRRVYNRNLKIYSGVDNRIDLQVKNTDQKAIEVSNSTLVFNLIGRENQKLILTKSCTAVDATTGKFYVTITEADALNLQPGFYNYTLHKEDNLGAKTPLYVDSQYGVSATLELVTGMQGTPTESLEITKFKHFVPRATGDAGSPFAVSSLIDANYNLTGSHSNHTFSFHFTDYLGSIDVQASLNESATPGETTWVTLDTLVIDKTLYNTSEFVTYFNTVGKWRWFRVKQSSHIGASAYFSVQQTTLGNYIVDLNSPGLNYSVGETLVILGSDLGGHDGTNDITITVTGIDPVTGALTSNGFTYTGTSIIGFRTFLVGATSPAPEGSLDKILYR